jgi:hypothetical protein
MMVAGDWGLVTVCRTSNQQPATSSQQPATSGERKTLREKNCVRILRHDHNWHLSCAPCGRVISRHFSQLEILAAPSPRTIN